MSSLSVSPSSVVLGRPLSGGAVWQPVASAHEAFVCGINRALAGETHRAMDAFDLAKALALREGDTLVLTLAQGAQDRMRAQGYVG